MKKNSFVTKGLVFVTVIILVGTILPSAVSSTAPYVENKSPGSYVDKVSRSGSSEDTGYYAVIAACTKYKDWKNNIPKPPLPPFPERKLKPFYDSLLKSYNWNESNIILLLNEDATRQKIIDALEEMADLVGPNDVFLFSWNGHGSEVPDDDGDESLIDPNDEYDEVICPYDIEKDENKNLINCITDDELNDYFSNITCKGMCLLFESCLSGGLIDRDSSSSREGTGTIDVNGNNRVVIMSTMPDTLGRASFLTVSPLLTGMAMAFNGFAKDRNGDGFISAEEAFKIARPLAFLQSSLFWIGNWVQQYLYFMFDLYEVIPFKNPTLVEKLFDRPALSATCSVILAFIYTQLLTRVLKGHFILNWPHMTDNYDGDLPIIEL